MLNTKDYIDGVINELAVVENRSLVQIERVMLFINQVISVRDQEWLSAMQEVIGESSNGYPLPNDFFLGKSNGECLSLGYNNAKEEIRSRLNKLME